MKVCSRCAEEKSIEEFTFDKNRKDKRYPQCKICKRESRGRSYKKNRSKELEYAKLYCKENEKKVKLYRKQYKMKHRKQRNEYEVLKRKIDTNYKLAYNLRCRLYKAIKKDFKIGSAVSDLGCTIEELKQYLESQFQTGMSWDNWSVLGWHIDHIKPLASFDLSDREQFLEACCYSNLQPLWAEDNLKKHSKV